MGEVKKCESCGRDIYEGTECEDCKKQKRSMFRNAVRALAVVLMAKFTLPGKNPFSKK